MTKQATRREFWVRPEDHEDPDDFGICFETEPKIQNIKKYIHVREVLPGEVTLTMDELQAAWIRATAKSKYKDGMAFHELETELFPEGTRG